MTVDIEIDYARRTVRKAGPPRFRWFEVRGVELGESGIPTASFAGESEREFGVEEWRDFLKSGGEFSSIGIVVDPRPVPGFDDYVRGKRKDLLHVDLVIGSPKHGGREEVDRNREEKVR